MDEYRNVGDKVAGCSVRGSKHSEVDVPCGDAWDGLRLNEDKFAIAVADGLGDASLSYQGSKLVTNKAITALDDWSTWNDSITSKTAQLALRNAVESARKAALEKASELNESPASLDTTLLVAVLDSDKVAGVGVGDGGIVCSHQDSFKPLIPRERSVVDLPYPNITIPLQHEEWDSSYRFGYCEDSTGVCLFSDGVEDFAWNEQHSASPEFFQSVFSCVRDNPAPVSAQNLAKKMKTEPYTEVGDDRTIVVGDLVPP